MLMTRYRSSWSLVGSMVLATVVAWVLVPQAALARRPVLTKQATAGSSDPLIMKYEDDTDAEVNIINPTSEFLCANFYVFNNDEQMEACCSCELSPDGFTEAAQDNDILGAPAGSGSNTITPAVFTDEGLYVLVPSLGPGSGSGTPCDASNTFAEHGTLVAYYDNNGSGPKIKKHTIEETFTKVDSDPTNLANLQNDCLSIETLGSLKAGICDLDCTDHTEVDS